jgi:hypothetical protein
LAMSPSGVLIGRMPYRANEGGALISRGMKLYRRDSDSISFTNAVRI